MGESLRVAGARSTWSWVAAAFGSAGLAFSWAGIYSMAVAKEGDADGSVAIVPFLFFVFVPVLSLILALAIYVCSRVAGISSGARSAAATSLASSIGACSTAVVLYPSVMVAIAYYKPNTNALRLWQFDSGILLGALALVVVTALASRLSGGWLRGALTANLVTFVIACLFAYRLINWYVFEWKVGS